MRAPFALLQRGLGRLFFLILHSGRDAFIVRQIDTGAGSVTGCLERDVMVGIGVLMGRLRGHVQSHPFRPLVASDQRPC